jgi:hypothetical protein
MWMNPDLKVYKAEVTLDSNDVSLRSGMNCKAEIIVEQYADVVYVPVETVLRVGGKPTVYVFNEDGAVEERKVETALDNNSVIRIASGLNEGELVLLKPPLKAGAVEPGARLAGIRGVSTDDMMRPANQSRGRGWRVPRSRGRRQRRRSSTAGPERCRRGVVQNRVQIGLQDQRGPNR